jgi:hypothetical protein
MVCSILFLPVTAFGISEFGYNLHPGKLLENTSGTLQVFVSSNNMMVPRTIDGLQVTSSDNSVIQVIQNQDSGSGYIKNVQIRALKPGVANIALAAPGFASTEVPIQVYHNNNYPTQILLKVTPNDFPIDGPRSGYISVELATTAGLPTVASEDIIIRLETPNTNIINLKNAELAIKKGDYFALSEFDVINSGDAMIFASTPGMKKVSDTVHVRKPTHPLQVQLYVLPKHYSSYSTTTGYAIVQLLDGEGLPVKAEEDIVLKLRVENPDLPANKSHNFDEILFASDELIIKKGTYSAYTSFTPRPNVGAYALSGDQEYNMFVSTNNYLTKGDSFTMHHDTFGSLEGTGPSFTTVLPFLTSGEKEIIAVTYLETDITVSRDIKNSNSKEITTVSIPVKAKENYQVTFSSSELNTVSPIPPIMKKGQNAVIVFGNTGVIAPDDGVMFYITDNQGVKSAAGFPVGPIKDNLSLVVEPLVSAVLAGSKFPVLAYMLEHEDEDDNGDSPNSDDKIENSRIGVTPFIENSVLTFSANDYVDVESQNIKKNQHYVLTHMLSEKVGDTVVSFQSGSFKGSMPLSSYTTDPTKMHLSYMENLFVNTKSLATVQLLDSIGNPVYAKQDIIVKMVSNNRLALEIPEQLIIKKGEYFNTFELESIAEGSAELTLLSENLPMSKYQIKTISVDPILSMSLPETISWNERIEANLSVAIKEIDVELNGFSVVWSAYGGQVIQEDTITNKAGNAKINIIANDADTVRIEATVSGNGLGSSTIAKTVRVVNMPVDEPIVDDVSNTNDAFFINDSNMFYVIVPAMVGAAVTVLKRTNRLDSLVEKIGGSDRLNPIGLIGEKFAGIKERLSNIRSN